MTLPLWRRRVVVTRPRARAGRWVEAFTAAGADVILFPVFEMRAAPAEENDRALRLLRDLLAERPSIPRPWIALTSAASAEHFTALLDSVDLLDEARAQFRFAAVGPATRAALAARGVEAALSPEHASGAAVAREILQVAAVPPVVIHPTSSRGLHDIEEAITAAAGTAHRLIVSEHRPLPDLDPALIERELDERGLDLLTFASPSAAETLLGICPEPLATRLRALPTLAVGETTAGTLRHLGFQAIHTPATPRVEDVVERAVGALG